jgi:hypothetical protein
MVYFNTHKTYYDIPIHFDTPPSSVKAYILGNSIRVEADIKTDGGLNRVSYYHQEKNTLVHRPTAPLTTS